jgi:hypothetical protein
MVFPFLRDWSPDVCSSDLEKEYALPWLESLITL